MILQLGNKSIEVDKDFEHYNSIRILFSNKAAQYAAEFARKYKKCSDIDDGLPLFWQMLQTAMVEGVNKSCTFLFKAGVVDVSDIRFAEKYYERYICVDDRLELLADKLEEIAILSENAEMQQLLRKQNRGRWYGGGFGIKGAIAGAVNAAALNVATNAVYSVGDFFRGVGKGFKIQKLKSAIFENADIFYSMFDAIYHAHLGSFYGLYDELAEHKSLKPLYFDTNYAKRVMDNAEKYTKDKTQKEALILKSILSDPYCVELYDTLLKCAPEMEGLEEFITYFGIKTSIEAYDSINLYLKIRKAARMPEKDFRQLTEKADAYISLSLRYRYNVVKEINELATKFKQVCSSVWDVQDAIRLVNSRFSNNIDRVNPILIALENHKQVLAEKAAEQRKKAEIEQQLKELSQIKERSHMSLEAYFKTLQDINDYSIKYNHNVSDFVNGILLRFGGWCDSTEGCSTAISGLSQLNCPYYPQIQKIIPALQARKKQIESNHSIDIKTEYVFSTVILDLVNIARSGNPAAQQLFVGLLYQYRFIEQIRSLRLNGSLEDKKNATKATEMLSDIIVFLFDRPESYSFDLFMRVNFSYFFADSIDEYIENISQFKSDEHCVAGIYEYGRVLCKNKSFEAGLPYIQAAAAQGYSRAARHLYKHYSELDKHSFDTIFYWLSCSTREENYIDEPDKENEVKVATLRILHDAIVGNMFSAESNEKVSKYFRDVLDEFTSVNGNISIGYLGDFSDKLILKASKKCLSVPNSENALLSYTYKKKWGRTTEIYMFLLSDKHFYWAEDNTNISSVAFEMQFATLKSKSFKYDVANSQKVWQVYTLFHYHYRQYSEDKPLSVLEKMAFSGNPLAICRLLLEPTISEDKKEIWRRHQQSWEQCGKYYAVCPQCYKECSREDTFCPDCGTRI